MSYKKRAKAGWNTDKASSNKSERMYEKEELKQELEEVASKSPDRVVESSGKRVKKKSFKYPEEREITRLTKKLNRAKSWLDRNSDRGFSGEDWMSRVNMRSKAEVAKIEPKLAELQKKLQKKKDLDEE